MSQPYPHESTTTSRKLDETPDVEREDRKRQAAALLRQWMSEPDEYDHEVWPLIKEELGDLRMRCRE